MLPILPTYKKTYLNLIYFKFVYSFRFEKYHEKIIITQEVDYIYVKIIVYYTSNLKYLYVQGFRLPQWHVVLLECLRWDTHAAGQVLSVA